MFIDCWQLLQIMWQTACKFKLPCLFSSVGKQVVGYNVRKGFFCFNQSIVWDFTSVNWSIICLRTQRGGADCGGIVGCEDLTLFFGAIVLRKDVLCVNKQKNKKYLYLFCQQCNARVGLCLSYRPGYISQTKLANSHPHIW